MLREERHQPRRTPKFGGADRQSVLRSLHALAELDQTLVGFLRHHVQAVERSGVPILESRKKALFYHPVLVGGAIQALGSVLEVSSTIVVLVDDGVELLQGEGIRVLDSETGRICSGMSVACVGVGVGCELKVVCCDWCETNAKHLTSSLNIPTGEMCVLSYAAFVDREREAGSKRRSRESNLCFLVRCGCDPNLESPSHHNQHDRYLSRQEVAYNKNQEKDTAASRASCWARRNTETSAQMP